MNNSLDSFIVCTRVYKVYSVTSWFDLTILQESISTIYQNRIRIFDIFFQEFYHHVSFYSPLKWNGGLDVDGTSLSPFVVN